MVVTGRVVHISLERFVFNATAQNAARAHATGRQGAHQQGHDADGGDNNGRVGVGLAPVGWFGYRKAGLGVGHDRRRRVGIRDGLRRFDQDLVGLNVLQGHGLPLVVKDGGWQVQIAQGVLFCLFGIVIQDLDVVVRGLRRRGLSVHDVPAFVLLVVVVVTISFGIARVVAARVVMWL